MSSRSFGTFKPKVPHLVQAGGGLKAEIGLLREQIEEAFVAAETELDGTNPCVFQSLVTPIQALDADGIMTAQASAAAPQTFDGTTFDGILAVGTGAAVIKVPKRMTIVIAGTGASWLGGTVSITGKDADGAAQTEDLVVAAGAGTTTGVKYWSEISEVVCPASTDDQATIGLGVAAEVACIANGASSASAQLIDANNEFNRDRVGNRVFDGPARALALVLSSHANWDATTAVVTGIDENDDVITENFSIPNNGNATVDGVKFFKQVTSIAIPAQSGTAGTWSLGIRDTILGLPKKVINAALAVAVIREASRADTATAWSDPTDGTITAPASALPNGSYTPHGSAAPDGARGHLLVYVADLG